MATHSSPCSTVPTTAWYAPPPATNGVTPACECVHQSLDITALNPLPMTEHSTHTSGVRATTIDSVTRTVATAFAIRRCQPSPENVLGLRGRSNIDVIGCVFWFRS